MQDFYSISVQKAKEKGIKTERSEDFSPLHSVSIRIPMS
jgi:hypothetical protein